jgi:hypothetical protein
VGLRGPKPGSVKNGGRRKGSKNKAIAGYKAKYLPREIADQITAKDQSGRTMADIQLDAARWFEKVAIEEREKPNPNMDLATKYLSMGAKIAHDASGFIYPTRQQIRHSGDEDEPPIRVENLSDYQLQKLIERLRRS